MTPNSLRHRSGCAGNAPYLRRIGFAAALALLVAGTACSKQTAEDTSGQTGNAQSAATKGTGPVVAKVNGVEIRESDLALAEQDIGQQLPPMSPNDKRDYLVNYVGDMILLTQTAEAKKMNQGQDFQQQLEFARKKLLMGKLLQEEGKAAVTDAALHKVYDDAVKQMKPEQEIRARHILVSTEDEAKAIRTQLQSGADFAKLAKEKSKDPTAATQGGELGYFTKEQMVPEFAEAAFKLDKGQISEPVKTSFGWHIIEVEDKRMKPVPTFDQVRPQLERYVVRKAQADYLTKLRQTAKIERLDKPAEQPQAAPGAMAPQVAPTAPKQTPQAKPTEPAASEMAPPTQPEPEKK
jgi:peptidyl-prolyl cis-trans isomerase C